MQSGPCPTCGGRGEVITTPCHTCRGQGLERKTVKKIVAIPAGVDNETQIRLAGEGEPGAFGGPQGICTSFYPSNRISSSNGARIISC